MSAFGLGTAADHAEAYARPTSTKVATVVKATPTAPGWTTKTFADGALD